MEVPHTDGWQKRLTETSFSKVAMICVLGDDDASRQQTVPLQPKHTRFPESLIEIMISVDPDVGSS
jgi:hypothetical protein